MEKMFGQMMQGFFSGMTEEDKGKMKACFEKMAVACPCCHMKDMPEAIQKAMTGKMKSFCAGKTEG